MQVKWAPNSILNLRPGTRSKVRNKVSAIQGVRGSALLTVESNSGLKPAYFFTVVPDPSPMLSRPHTAIILGKLGPYTSDENVLLVRLKEKEAMSWSEITAHFPGRNMSSL
ncbi:hypothetical protein N7447_000003 [Penicillium robsamsonii]|uniref:uncharacterized protein n=1 Tax=Penicillium robsamsonii TaxID=1792511 RepID=UPI002548848F|nr:uncharacterized protein N7447_000003 [Penicillium robsamsonii]KAJ5833977.1 hypothetical protein N7447_000003 [Penicillium robsamsonii]